MLCIYLFCNCLHSYCIFKLTHIHTYNILLFLDYFDTLYKLQQCLLLLILVYLVQFPYNYDIYFYNAFLYTALSAAEQRLYLNKVYYYY